MVHSAQRQSYSGVKNKITTSILYVILTKCGAILAKLHFFGQGPRLLSCAADVRQKNSLA